MLRGRQQALVDGKQYVASAKALAREDSRGDSGAETDYLAAKVALWTITHSWSDTEMEVLVSAFAGCVAPINKRFAELLDEDTTLTASEKARVRGRVKSDHLVCVIAVALLEAYDRLDTELHELAAKAAQTLAMGLFPTTAEGVFARAAAEMIFKQTASLLMSFVTDEKNILALRFVGALSCPDWTEHPEDGVWEYCIKPVFLKALEQFEQDWVTAHAGPLFT